MDPVQATLLCAAGVLAGAVNAVAGGGSLIAFSALIGVGIPPLTAKMTNTVAVFPGNVASVAGGYRDLPARREAVRILPAALLGGVAGSVLLLLTPTRVFDLIVPFVVLVASVVFALQERLTVWTTRTGRRHRHPAARHALVAAGGVYGGYIGASFGIVLLTSLAFLQDASLARTVAVKNLLLAAVSFAAVLLFVVLGRVDWSAVALLAPATVVGGYGGARLVRRLPERLIRAVIVTFGTAFGLALLWQNTR
ncbi:sulfite exporter TauE/SafE family protein [Micromonospora sp. NPDC023956]|uniref:sulfite exporter TauE/SafE family protein n=1 Tax=Micromonospora sp. NPDC023956 TaxID=3155722 RepID=UPI0033EB7FFF